MSVAALLDQHNENTTRYITVTFVNKSKIAEAPASARYRVDNVSETTAVVAWTAIATPQATEEIVVNATQNAIVNAANEKETIEVTIEGTYSADDKVSEKIQYELNNLTYIP